MRAECIRGELELPGDMYIPGEMYIVTPEIMEFLQTLGRRIVGLERIIGCDKDQPDCDGDTAQSGAHGLSIHGRCRGQQNPQLHRPPERFFALATLK